MKKWTITICLSAVALLTLSPLCFGKTKKALPVRKAPARILPKPAATVAVKSASPSSLNVTPGAKPVTVTVTGTNLNLITSAVLTSNGWPVKGTKVTLGPANPTKRNVSVYAENKTKPVTNCQLRLIADKQTINLSAKTLGINISTSKPANIVQAKPSKPALKKKPAVVDKDILMQRPPRVLSTKVNNCPSRSSTSPKPDPLYFVTNREITVHNRVLGYPTHYRITVNEGSPHHQQREHITDWIPYSSSPKYTIPHRIRNCSAILTFQVKNDYGESDYMYGASYKASSCRFYLSDPDKSPVIVWFNINDGQYGRPNGQPSTTERLVRLNNVVCGKVCEYKVLEYCKGNLPVWELVNTTDWLPYSDEAQYELSDYDEELGSDNPSDRMKRRIKLYVRDVHRNAQGGITSIQEDHEARVIDYITVDLNELEPWLENFEAIKINGQPNFNGESFQIAYEGDRITFDIGLENAQSETPIDVYLYSNLLGNEPSLLQFPTKVTLTHPDWSAEFDATVIRKPTNLPEGTLQSAGITARIGPDRPENPYVEGCMTAVVTVSPDEPPSERATSESSGPIYGSDCGDVYPIVTSITWTNLENNQNVNPFVLEGNGGYRLTIHLNCAANINVPLQLMTNRRDLLPLPSHSFTIPAGTNEYSRNITLNYTEQPTSFFIHAILPDNGIVGSLKQEGTIN